MRYHMLNDKFGQQNLNNNEKNNSFFTIQPINKNLDIKGINIKHNEDYLKIVQNDMTSSQNHKYNSLAGG